MTDDAPAGGPWTRHGHAIPGVTVAASGQPPLARCGGPSICGQCAIDAASATPTRPADPTGDDTRLHEWQCPSCGATTRARMADHDDGAPDTGQLREEIIAAVYPYMPPLLPGLRMAVAEETVDKLLAGPLVPLLAAAEALDETVTAYMLGDVTGDVVSEAQHRLRRAMLGGCRDNPKASSA